MAVDQGIVDSVATANIKTVSEGPAYFTNILYGNAVAHQQAMQQIQLAATGSIVKGLTEMDIGQAVAVLKAAGGLDPGVLASLMAALGGGQVMAKEAQTTPPVT